VEDLLDENHKYKSDERRKNSRKGFVTEKKEKKKTTEPGSCGKAAPKEEHTTIERGKKRKTYPTFNKITYCWAL